MRVPTSIHGALLAGVLAIGGLLTGQGAALADEAPVTITWLAATGQSPHAPDPKAKAWFTSQVDAFQKKHPGVTLDISYEGTDINQAMTRLQQQIGAGRAPDVASLDSFFLSRFYDSLQPLDAYYPAEDVNDFVSFAKQGMHGPDGKLKAIWANTDVRALFYRKDLVQTPPKTWDELIAMGPALTQKGVTPYVFPGGRGEAAVMEHLGMFWAMGGQLVDDKNQPVFGQGANKDAWVKILTFMKKAVDSGASPRRVVGYGFESDMNPELLRGNVAMFLGGSWQSGQLHNLGDTHQWGVAPIPMPSDIKPSTAAGGWTYGMFATDPAKQKLIVEFINDVAGSKDGMAGEVTALTNLPTRRSVAARATPYFTSEDNKTFGQMLTTAHARPGAAIYPTISTELQVAIANAITGQQTPEEAVDGAWSRVQQQAGK